MSLVTVTCPACGQTAAVPAAAASTATCNAHDRHHHRRGELMRATGIDNERDTE